VARTLFFSLLSLLLLFVDARFNYLESVRSVLAIVVYPVQRLTTLPGSAWQQVGAYLHTQNHLIEENVELRQQHDLDSARLQELHVLQQENAHLLNLLEVKQHSDYPMQLAEIIYAARDLFKRKIVLNKGSKSDVQLGQPVMDDVGIVGQVTRVYPWLAEVTLLTDKDHAVPIQVLRNGLRAVVFGSGDISNMSLRYMPVNADVQVGDELVTSGIDGIYPAGLPVAKVSKVERNPVYPFAQITCLPLAGVDSHRYLLVLSGVQKLTERPVDLADSEDDKTKRVSKRRNQ
jgi:rod shape-determining protein MreC